MKFTITNPVTWVKKEYPEAKEGTHAVGWTQFKFPMDAEDAERFQQMIRDGETRSESGTLANNSLHVYEITA